MCPADNMSLGKTLIFNLHLLLVQQNPHPKKKTIKMPPDLLF